MHLSLNPASPDLITFLCTNRQSKSSVVSGVKFNKDLSSADVQEMLSYLAVPDDYEEWYQIGMALKHGGYSFDLWDTWSKKSAKYEANVLLNKWDTFNGSGITIGTLVYKAKQSGWQRSRNPERFGAVSPETTKTSFPLHHWSELNTLPRRNYLVKGLLDCGGMSVVYGASNSGKTFLALDISCHISLGREWAGRKVKPGAVVYISAEGGLGVRERLDAFRQHYSIDSYGDLYVIPACVPLNKEQSFHNELIEQIRGIDNLRLVVVDTLARAMGSGDENSAADMGAFVSHCDSIREITGAHVLIVHHTGKDESRGARGSSALKAATDTEIHVTQSQGIISAEITKQRDGRTGDVLAFSLQTYPVGVDEDGDTVVSCAMVQTEQAEGREVLSGQCKRAFEVLCNLMIDKGTDYIPKKGMRAQRVVRLDDFKTDFLKAGIAQTDKADSVDKAFFRAKEKLKTKGYIGEWDGYIWLADKKDKTGQTGISILSI